MSEMLYRIKKSSGGCPEVGIWTKYLYPFNEFFIALNGSFNFFIYAYFYSDFKNVLLNSPIIRRLLIAFSIDRSNSSDESNSLSRTHDIELRNINGTFI